MKREKIVAKIFHDEKGDGMHSMCLHAANQIWEYIIKHGKQNEIDFLKIIDGTFWGKVKDDPNLGYMFVNFIERIKNDFGRGFFSDDYKFPKVILPSKGYVSVKIAAKYLDLTDRRIQQLAKDEDKLKFRYKKNRKDLEIEVESLKELKRNR